MRWIVLCLLFASAAGCYGRSRASRDINAAWEGEGRAEIEASWGQPEVTEPGGEGEVLVWTHTRETEGLPSVEAEASIDPGELAAEAEVAPGEARGGVRARLPSAEAKLAVRRGEVRRHTTQVAALVDAEGTIVRVQGPSWRWGPPPGTNMRRGLLLGMHVGMGRLDNTPTPLPSGSAHIGGMLGPRTGLVGTFSLVSGIGDGGGAMGLASGIAATWWPLSRMWVRAGPALTIDWNPGFEDTAFGLGATGGASYALVKAGAFVLDLRLDLTATRTALFGSAGIGVNIN